MFRYVHLAILGHRIKSYVWALDAVLGVKVPSPICSCGKAI